MKIECVFVGKTSERYLDDGITDFCKRLRRYVPVTIKIVKDSKSKASAAEIIRLEGQGILKAVPKQSFLIALDPKGKKLSSEALARQMSQWQLQNRQTVVFVIGGSDGLAAEVLLQADFTLSLSAMTFTHDMSRLILLEQLYRAYSIIAGSKYHK